MLVGARLPSHVDIREGPGQIYQQPSVLHWYLALRGESLCCWEIEIQCMAWVFGGVCYLWWACFRVSALAFFLVLLDQISLFDQHKLNSCSLKTTTAWCWFVCSFVRLFDVSANRHFLCAVLLACEKVVCPSAVQVLAGSGFLSSSELEIVY
jgi:hypothetical protein